eukprot:4655443-Pleurochrysis_carterae.AAC.1
MRVQRGPTYCLTFYMGQISSLKDRQADTHCMKSPCIEKVAAVAKKARSDPAHGMQGIKGVDTCKERQLALSSRESRACSKAICAISRATVLHRCTFRGTFRGLLFDQICAALGYDVGVQHVG